MKRAFIVAAGLLVTLGAGCGGTDSAQTALTHTQQNLGKIRSGNLSLTLSASPSGATETRVGFELEGAFAVADDKGDLPLAELTYTRITGDERVTRRFVSTRTAAFVEVDGRWEELAEADVSSLRAGAAGEGAAEGLEGLRLDEWINDPGLRRGPAVDGDPTDLVTAGTVDPIAVLNDLVGFAAGFESDPDALPGPLEGESSERLRRVVSKSEASLLTGRGDRLLRRATVVLEMEADADEVVREALGPLAGVRLEMTVAVTDLNDEVSVDPPPTNGDP